MDVPSGHGPPGSGGRAARRAAWILLALAVAIRWAALHTHEMTSWALWPQVDAWTYWDQARALFQGKDPFAEGYYQPPGYPWLLSAWFRLAGEATLHGVRALHLLLGFLTTAGILWLGTRLGRRLGRPWVGPLAAGLHLLYPRTLLFELEILTPAVTSALLVGAMVLLWTEARPRAWRWGTAGLLVGLAAMVHPTFLLLVPALALGGVGWPHAEGIPRATPGRGKKRKKGEVPPSPPVRPGSRSRERWWGPTLLLAGVLLGVAPTALTNAVRWQQAALVSHNAGLNLYLGNNPDWKRTAFLRAGIPFRAFVLEAEPAERDQFERNRYWLQRVRAENLASPGTFVAGLAEKALWSVNRREIPRNEDLDCRTGRGPTRWLGWLPARWWWVFPLAVLGAAAGWRRDPRVRLAALGWAALHAVLVLFLVTDRYRVAAWPLVALLGGVGLAEVLAWRRWADVRALGWRGAAVGLAVILPWVPIDPVTAFQPGWCRHLEGNLAVSEERYADAVALYEEALALDPDDVDARRWMAESLLRLDRPGDATAVLRPVADRYETVYPVQYLMYRAERARGNREGAIHYLRRAWRVPGPRTSTGAKLVALLVEAGRTEEARRMVLADPELARHPKVREVLAGGAGAGDGDYSEGTGHGLETP